MTIERFAGLNDKQNYTVLIYNETTKKTVKGLKVTGRELQAMARALDALVKQQFAIDGIQDNQNERQAEAVEEHSFIPDTGGNPLDNPDGGAIGGYESTFMSPNKPQAPKPDGLNAGGPPAITENPTNQRPPKLP